MSKLDAYRDDVHRIRDFAFANPLKSPLDMAKYLMRLSLRGTGITRPDLLINMILSFEYDSEIISSGAGCLHLSLSVSGYLKNAGFKMNPKPKVLDDKTELLAWSNLVFADLYPNALDLLWKENTNPSHSAVHIRLFYDLQANEPFMPEEGTINTNMLYHFKTDYENEKDN